MSIPDLAIYYRISRMLVDYGKNLGEKNVEKHKGFLWVS